MKKIDAYVVLKKVREVKPVVHHLTNWVTIYDCANIVKVLGASPVMAHAREGKDVEEELLNLYIDKKNWERAASLLGEMLDRDAGNADLRLRLGKVLSWDNKYGPALEQFDRVLETEPGNYEALKESAYIYAWTQRWREAEARFKRLIEARPHDTKLKEQLGDIYFYQNRYYDAGLVYGQILTSNSESFRYLGSRLNEIRFLTGPVVSYAFSYYYEKDQRVDDSTRGNRHSVGITWPIGDAIRPSFSASRRHDNSGNATILDAGMQCRLLSVLWTESHFYCEENLEDNPRYRISGAANLTPSDLFDIQLTNEYARYWGDENESNSAALQAACHLLKDRSLHLRYGLHYDWIDKPSDYFISIERHAGKRDFYAWTNLFSAEKEIRLFNKISVTPGYSLSFKRDSATVVGHTLYGYVSVHIRHVDLVLNGSWGWSTRHIENGGMVAYVAWRF